MHTHNILLAALLTLSALPGCAPEHDAAGIEADGDEVRATLLSFFAYRSFEIPADLGNREARVVFRDRASFRAYFRRDAPDGVDFRRQWLVYYSAGVLPSADYRASILRMSLSATGQTVSITTELAAPGDTCAARPVPTRHHVLAVVDRPRNNPATRFLQRRATLDCRAAAGQDCRADAACQPGLRCIGIPGDGSSDLGVCQDLTRLPGEGQPCQDYGTCAAFSTQLLCGGGSESAATGTCVAGWMGNTFRSTVQQPIPDGRGALDAPLVVRGLASVPTDLAVVPMIHHGRRQDLRITLLNPSGTPSVIFDRAGSGWWIPGERIVVRSFPSDESVNGRWTLRVEDLAAGTAGTLASWSMDVISRWD